MDGWNSEADIIAAAGSDPVAGLDRGDGRLMTRRSNIGAAPLRRRSRIGTPRRCGVEGLVEPLRRRTQPLPVGFRGLSRPPSGPRRRVSTLRRSGRDFMGQADGLPRYRCRGCGRTFNGLTKTPLARLRKREKWREQAQSMIDGVTTSKAAERCEVDYKTAFRWRHRFLSSIVRQTQDPVWNCGRG